MSEEMPEAGMLDQPRYPWNGEMLFYDKYAPQDSPQAPADDPYIAVVVYHDEPDSGLIIREVSAAIVMLEAGQISQHSGVKHVQIHASRDAATPSFVWYDGVVYPVRNETSLGGRFQGYESQGCEFLTTRANP